MTWPAEIFDRALLVERRRRALARLGNDDPPDFLLQHAARDVIERLGLIKRRFEAAISIGSYYGVVGRRLLEMGVGSLVETEAIAGLLEQCSGEQLLVDEEALGTIDARFDLAVSVLSLQYANDLPGVLANIRGLLKPDGLFIGVVLGGGTLHELRQAMLAAEAEVTGGASPRIMPFVDVRDAGSLLQRAGFALPVTDVETVTVTYADGPLALMRELKAMGASNVLRERSRRPLTRGQLLRAAEIYVEQFALDATGRIPATFELVTLTGWAPDPSQQKPLKPGSAQVSLADVLRRE